MDVPVTAAGLEKMRNELDAMIARQPEIQAAIARAREQGDLKENAEYHAAREEFGMLTAKIDELRTRIARARIVEVAESERDVIRFGATVKVKDSKRKTVEEYTLVGAGEDDILDNKILATSPMGQAMLGKKPGDAFEVKTPREIGRASCRERV